jgi:hypothetical protein
MQTILALGLFLVTSSAPQPLSLAHAARCGTLVVRSVATLRAPQAAMLFSVENGVRRRVYGLPSDSGRTCVYDLSPGEYVDATSARTFRVVATR